MNLLFIAERFPPDIGGVAASAGRIAHSLADLHHRVDVVAFARELPVGAVESKPVTPRLTVHRLGQAKSLDFTLQQALTFLEWLHGERRFDAVWGHYITTAGFLATWFGVQHSIASILSVRGNDFDRELFPPGDFGRLRWCLERASIVACVSQDLARKTQVLVQREALVLPNSVDCDRFAPGPRSESLIAQYAIRPEEVVLGFSGELRAKKGLPFLLHAFRETLERQPARLLLIGEVRPQDRGEYERLTAAPEVRERIILTGHLESPALVAQHVRLADVMLFPSLWEGMPNSLLESMAAGVPVIASDAGAVPEVVTDGVEGLVLPRTHLHLLSQRIDELFSMPGESRRTMIAAARERVLRNHSPQAESTRLAELLARLSVRAGELDTDVETSVTNAERRLNDSAKSP
ncbi:MAG: glycosyltransferase family 4 protein [Pirellulales bacterium]